MAAGIVLPMLIRPAPPLHRHHRRGGRGVAADRPFTLRSDLGATILRMISTHSLPAFTPAIDRTVPVQAPREAAAPATSVFEAAAPAAQRPLEAVPAQPGRPVPRGSLLDLKV